MKCLMVAFAFVLPYHVMRTAAAAGYRVHVLGNGASRGLRWSRHCASYRESRWDWHRPDAGPVLDEIRHVVRQRGIDMILPSDDVSTRLLAAHRDTLPVPTSLVPDAATFDLLNDKWRFTRYCLDHDVRVPQGWLLPDAAELTAALRNGTLTLPITAKPLSCSAGVGVVHLRDASDLKVIETIDYRPIVVQRHILGETIGFNVLSRDGEILAHASQRRDDHRFELWPNPDLLDNIERLVGQLGFTGAANFDAVLERETGLNYIVECNPRFWYTIYMSMILGVNFVDLALRGRGAPAPTPGTMNLSLGDIARHPRGSSAFDRAMLRYHLGDPIPFALQRAHMVDDRDVFLPPRPMQRCDPTMTPEVATAPAYLNAA
jgi:predicted ATP-grasp superfamily ATP-dependent carboligase